MEEGQKILIVDDQPVNIQALNSALKPDYKIFFATNGEDALELAKTTNPDLILLDIMMTGMDGYEVCKRLKSDSVLKDIPVIFVTAMSEEANETIGLELGAVDYITKPFNPAIVKLRVKNHLELKRQRDILARLSSIDGLTGIANRRAFDEFFDKQWNLASRTKLHLSIIMVDVDYFKSFNDNYGHIAGDECLKKVAKAINSSLGRSSDMVARYGGEEFVCLLPGTDLTGLELIVEKIRIHIAELKIPHAYSSVSNYVTVSIGATSTIPSQESSSKTFLELADQLLYEAKKEGRNRAKILER